MADSSKRFQVTEDKRQSWVSLAAVWTGAMVCIPCLMIGGFLSQGYSWVSMILPIIIGYGIICLYMCFLGMEGCDIGQPTVTMAAGALGEIGSRFIISIIIAVSCIGWFGIQASVCGSSFTNMVAGMGGPEIPVPVSSIIWGVIMLLTAMFGYNSVKYLNYVAVPLLIIVFIYAIIRVLIQGNGMGEVLAYPHGTPMTFVAGVNMVVATFAVGGVISADYSRYAKNRGDVIKSTVLGVLPSGMVVLLVGGACAIAAGQYDITQVLQALGVPAIGLVALILATWTTNVANAYSGGLGVSNIFGLDESKFKITTGIAGLLGTILGAFGIMAQFSTFLNIMTSFIPPVAGVVIASYWIIGKGKKESFAVKENWNIAGIIAYIVGAVIAYITSSVAPFFIAPINGIVISIVLYVVLAKLTKK
jgi:cytosine permease